MKSQSGGTLVETAAGLCLIVPIVLFLIDVTAMVICQTANDALVKNAARAAADQLTPLQGKAAAGKIVTTYKNGNPGLASNATLISCDYSSPNSDVVTCITEVTCKLPVPVPFTSQSTQVFRAIDSEPVVGILP